MKHTDVLDEVVKGLFYPITCRWVYRAVVNVSLMELLANTSVVFHSDAEAEATVVINRLQWNMLH